MNVLKNFLFILSLLFLFSCSDNTASPPEPKTTKTNNLPTIKNKHLNISVLIDLSNRIDNRIHPAGPSYSERDIAIIQNLADAVKNNIEAFGAFKAAARLNIYFHPEPQDPQMAAIAKQLTAECKSGTTPEAAKHNKQVFASLDSNLKNGLAHIYTLAVQKKEYPGSNIWRFMKDEASYKCMEDTTTFRNILVILTDGYLYDVNERHQNGNRFSYIERNFPHFTRFRDQRLLHTQFDQQNYGLEPIGKKLNGLEVLVMEVAPEEKYPQDYDIIKKYWEKWLKEMNVTHSAIIKTQQPEYAKQIIAKFLLKQPL
ncbi:MAG: hypothetical protein ICV53_13520 [Flavisolibacter sp.]|nr:hypothetical protein [Flavisolibacter sp.]